MTALEKKWIKGAGLDVLAVENPVLKNHPLLKRTNVSVTPHAAFYSVNSITELQRISCQNIVNFFAGNHTKVDRFVSEPAKVTK
nr:NAD(P)-dependent oxidoreductase [Liquorilactobacillus satsumensis]